MVSLLDVRLRTPASNSSGDLAGTEDVGSPAIDESPTSTAHEDDCSHQDQAASTDSPETLKHAGISKLEGWLILAVLGVIAMSLILAIQMERPKTLFSKVLLPYDASLREWAGNEAPILKALDDDLVTGKGQQLHNRGL